MSGPPKERFFAWLPVRNVHGKWHWLRWMVVYHRHNPSARWYRKPIPGERFDA